MKAALLAIGMMMMTTAPAHTVNRFSLTVPLGYPQSAVLFGPEGERAWAGTGWNPHFLHPQPARDVQGAVFTLDRGGKTMVWVNTLFDIEARHFQYVYIIPEVQTATIDVRFRPIDATHTAVDVTYARTALTTEANELVLEQGRQDAASGPEWQLDIEAGLKTKR